jgi:hypothetical protein
LFQRRWLNHALLILQLAYGGYVTATDFLRSVRPSRPTPTYGQQRRFTVSGPSTSSLNPSWPVDTDDLRWWRPIGDHNVFYRVAVVIQTTSGTHKLFVGDFDANRTIMRLKDPKDDRVWSGQTAPPVAEFTLENPQPDRLILEGEMDGQHVHAILQRTPIEFTLRKRGFHWIQSSPFFGEGIVI